ncbi:MAG: hypothetical protein PF436_01435 [Prolixibacteraceae bacterium]|jgi:hypothetical protein|nr:hypothetical protein [Prolixibacteraceae bacterium]
MKKLFFGICLCMLFCIQNLNAQKISISAQGGIAIPKGSVYGTDIEDQSFGVGLCYNADLLYHMGKFDEKLGLGLTYNGSIIMGAKVDDDGSDGGAYSLEMYGIKGYYHFFNKKVSPYIALSTGLSQFNHAGIGMSTEAIEAGYEKSYSLGLMPEFGVQMGILNFGVSYYVPMKYKSYTIEKQSAGALQFYVGIRYALDLKNAIGLK